MKDGTYKNLRGGLFSGEPLEVVKDPSREIRAQQVAESLRSLVIGECAIRDQVWKAVRVKLGYDDEPTEEWKAKVTEEVKFIQSVAQVLVGQDNKHASPKEKSGYLAAELKNLSRRLMKDA